MTARFIVADVFDGLAGLKDGSVDLVVTSPPFGWLRSYLPSDHPDKPKEIGQEENPAAFIDVLLAVTAELRRVLAPHGSICVELGDTYAGSGGAGGDYTDTGLRAGQEKFAGSAIQYRRTAVRNRPGGKDGGGDWPLAKSKMLLPEAYRLALAYGINPLTGQESPAGRWRVRNVVTWCRPNPPVGALGDKWRPATSDIVIACTSEKRYWDDLATRHHNPRANEFSRTRAQMNRGAPGYHTGDSDDNAAQNPAGAPMLDWWELPPGGYPGSHYAVYPPALVEPLIKAMAPPKVCRQCGEPSQRITETTNAVGHAVGRKGWTGGQADHLRGGAANLPDVNKDAPDYSEKITVAWTDCGHDAWRPSLILDPFAGSGTTLAVATGHGHDAIGIDLDERNRELAYERIGPFMWWEGV